MENIKKRVTIGALAAAVMATAVILPYANHADPSTITEKDITIAATSNLPSTIGEGETFAYSFVEDLSENMQVSGGPFSWAHGGSLGFDVGYSYNIPWVTKDFPSSGFEQLPVEYVYYEATTGDSENASPLYCIDYNAKSPVNESGTGGSYELVLHPNGFNKMEANSMTKEDFKNSTLMLAPMLYGFPSYSERYTDLTDAESRWATSMAFKFISGALYESNYTSGPYGLKYIDFSDNSMLPGITKQLQHIDPTMPTLNENIWNNSLLKSINNAISSSVNFGSESAGYEIVYNPSISGYTPDTAHSGQVMGAMYVMLYGAKEIRDDNGNFERTMTLSTDTSSSIKTLENKRYQGPYAIHLNQGTLYSSKNASNENGYLTDILLKDNLLISVSGNPSDVYLGEADGTAFQKSGNNYIVPTDTEFYIFSTSSDDVTYSLTATAQTVKNVDNSYYQSVGDPLTQRMLISSPLDIKGTFEVPFNRSTGTLKIVKIDASDNTTPIADVSFDVYSNASCAGTPVARITTASDGSASCIVEYGTYYLKEVSTPDNYIPLTEPIEVEVSEVTENSGEVKTITNTPLGSLKIVKKDSVSGEVLSGAKFTLTSTSEIIYNEEPIAAGTPIGGEQSSDSNGIIFWDKLPYGFYQLTETTSPNGYVLNPDPITIIISGNSTSDRFVEKEVLNTPYGSFEITKEDSTTKDKLSDAVFEVRTKSRITYKGNTYDADSVIATLTTDDNGYASLNELPLGTYTVTETSAPNGYQLDNTPRTIVISGESSQSLNKSIIIENTAFGSLKVVKEDARTGEALDGAVFNILATENIEYNGKNYVANDIIATLTTQNGGTAFLSNLQPSDYIVVEKKAPDGYVLNTKQVTVSVGSNDAVVPTAVVKNSPLGSLRIVKEDAQTGKTLGGAVFDILATESIEYNGKNYTANEIIATLTTRNDGMASLSNLQPSNYIVVEKKAPNGYVLNTKQVTVSVGLNDDTVSTIVIKNSPLGSLKIVKEDARTGETLDGAVFDILATENIEYNGENYTVNDIIATLTTQNGGTASISNLQPSDYIVVEKKAPDGYVLNTKQVTVSVVLNDNTVPTVVVKNSPLGSLTVSKYDKDSGARLANAKFDVITDSPIEFRGKKYSSGDIIESLVTNQNGEASLSDLPYGDYILRETIAPLGYTITQKDHPFTISDDNLSETLDVTIEVSNTALKGKFRISKTNPSKVPIKANFELYTVKDTYYNGKLIPAGSAILSFTTDSKGYYESPEIPVGKYKLKETQTEDNYLLPEGLMDVLITADSTNIQTIEVINYEKPAAPVGQLKIIKVDAYDDNKRIENVSFEIYDEFDNLVDQVNTDHDGCAVSKNLDYGTYYIKEVKAPSGYVLNNEKIKVEINDQTLQDNSVKTVLIENTPVRGRIKVIKVEKDHSERKLSGAVFDIIDASGNVVDTITTDLNGEASSNELPLGEYTVKETKAPEGYKLSSGPYSVVLKENGTDALVYESLIVENIRTDAPKGKIQIVKKDSVTKDPMQKVEFDLYANDDIIENDNVIYSKNQLIQTLTTDKKGMAETDFLPIGSYYIVESSIVDGYIENNKKYNFTITADNYSTLQSKTIYNVPTKVVITKEDITNSKPLMGATIEIYDEDGEKVYRDITDKNGEITAFYLAPGEYTFKEIAPPDGYEINPTEFEFEITEDGEVKGDTTVTDAPTEVTITKKDLTTGAPLAGATIEIKDFSGKTVFKEVSGPNGEVKAMHLKPGRYTFTETAAPDGYTRNPETFEFELFENGTVRGDCTITDTPTEVVITKKDLTTGAPLAGATIEIKDSNGSTVFKEVSGPNGEVKAMHLKPGKYTFTETAAPDGYTRNPETFEFELFEDGSVKGDCTITDTPTEVVITKKDISSAKPLPGATIQIVDSNGKLAFEGVTDENGIVRAFKLSVGKYTFREISAPDGYQLNMEEFNFELFEDGSVIGDREIYDERIPNIKTGVEDTTKAEPPVIPIVIAAILILVLAVVVIFIDHKKH